MNSDFVLGGHTSFSVLGSVVRSDAGIHTPLFFSKTLEMGLSIACRIPPAYLSITLHEFRMGKM